MYLNWLLGLGINAAVFLFRDLRIPNLPILPAELSVACVDLASPQANGREAVLATVKQVAQALLPFEDQPSGRRKLRALSCSI
jgi:hypothetical protein